jgi:hypothetical protein
MLNHYRGIVMSAAGAVFSIALIGVPTSVSAAVVYISSCNALCAGSSTTCTLSTDIACDNQPGISLSSGANLDLNGHGITCNSNCPSAAVQVSSSGSSLVQNSTGFGYITGFFPVAINCGGFSGTQVTGIRFSMLGNGILNCSQVTHNVIEGGRVLGSVGISLTGISGNDAISDNWISEWDTGVSVNTSHGINITNNQIGVEPISGSGAAQVGVSLTRTAGTSSLKYNFFFGGATSGTFIQTSGTVTNYGNSCDPADATCQTCSTCRGYNSVPF